MTPQANTTNTSKSKKLSWSYRDYSQEPRWAYMTGWYSGEYFIAHQGGLWEPLVWGESGREGVGNRRSQGSLEAAKAACERHARRQAR